PEGRQLSGAESVGAFHRRAAKASRQEFKARSERVSVPTEPTTLAEIGYETVRIQRILLKTRSMPRPRNPRRKRSTELSSCVRRPGQLLGWQVLMKPSLSRRNEAMSTMFLR